MTRLRTARVLSLNPALVSVLRASRSEVVEASHATLLGGLDTTRMLSQDLYVTLTSHSVAKEQDLA